MEALRHRLKLVLVLDHPGHGAFKGLGCLEPQAPAGVVAAMRSSDRPARRSDCRTGRSRSVLRGQRTCQTPKVPTVVGTSRGRVGTVRIRILLTLSPGPVTPAAGAYGGPPSPLPRRLLVGSGLGLEALADLPFAEVAARDGHPPEDLSQEHPRCEDHRAGDGDPVDGLGVARPPAAFVGDG